MTAQEKHREAVEQAMPDVAATFVSQFESRNPGASAQDKAYFEEGVYWGMFAIAGHLAQLLAVDIQYVASNESTVPPLAE